ncbi:integrator complex subunit 2-like [Dendronephthya gigantea]|uniref:integrator complex subunit 2-like n=1 Tax=Dendronephthya gigantea TaxID=151771 RepID=UPI00106CACA3|nr:integrator complex subunit 2-like [Dendronephthya gigantea]
MSKTYPSERCFHVARNVCISKLQELSDHDFRALLPSLVRMSQCPSLDESSHWQEAKKEIQKLLCGMEIVNSIVGLLSVDFGCLRQDCLKEKQIQRKLEENGPNNHSALIEASRVGLVLDFEQSEPSRRLRLVLRELLRVMSQSSENREFSALENCEFFECEVYMEDICDVLCIAQAELSELFPLDEVSKALLRVPNGPWFICRLLVNFPDYFEQVCSALLTKQDLKANNPFPSYIQTKALHHLCKMNPDYAMTIRSEAVKNCCLPELTVKLTLDCHLDSGERRDLVEFVSGLLLGSDIRVRKWFAHFIKNGQKHEGSVSNTALTQLREELLNEVVAITPPGHRERIRKEWQKGRKGQEGMSEGKRRITVDEQDKETLEIIEAMDMSTDFEIVQEEAQSSSPGQNDMPMDTSEQPTTLLEKDVISATAILRLFCALKGIAGMKISNKESDELVCLITSQAPQTAAGARFVTVGLCTMLACSGIVSTSEQEQEMIKWIKWLSKEESHYESSTGLHISFGESLLLTAIHFHSNNLEAITGLVSSTLGMRVRPGTLTRIKTIFTQDLFPEKAITEHAVRVAVTDQLTANDSGFLPVHCVYHLLKNRTFTKHSVQVKDWLYKQILCSSKPLHPLLVNLIDVFVTSVVMPLPSKHRRLTGNVTVEGFSETDILKVFKSQQRNSSSKTSQANLTAQLLILYYLLSYKDCCLSNMKSLVANNHHPPDYSRSLYSQIPIKYLLQQARKSQEHYRDLYPPLLRLLVTYYPQLCLVEDWLCEEDGAEKHTQESNILSTTNLTPLAVSQVLANLRQNPTMTMLTLLKLNKQDPRLLIPYVDAVVEGLRMALDPSVCRRVQILLKDLWMKLNTMIPRRLWLLTVNKLCDQTTESTPYLDDELIKDPLTALRCDQKIFRCAPIFTVITRVLMGYLAASRAMLNQHILANSNPGPSASGTSCSNPEQEREELKSALLAAQESAVVQILLEVCLKTPEEKQKHGGSMQKCELREIQCLVCSTLHQMFITDPKLAKLVHFQGYDPVLLPVTVNGIPSMHICLSFITELLNQPELEKQLFAVQLSSYLCVQFPLPKALDVAKYVISRMTSLCEALPGDRLASFFIPACECLLRFCRAFPPLSMDTSSLLMMIGQLTASRAAGGCEDELELSRYYNLLQDLHKNAEAGRDILEDLGFEDEDISEESEQVFCKVKSDIIPGSKHIVLYNVVRQTFKDLVHLCVIEKYGLSKS